MLLSGPDAREQPEPLRGGRLGAHVRQQRRIGQVGQQRRQIAPVYDDRACGNGEAAPPTSADPPELQPLIEQFVFRTTGRDVARPGCTAQGPYPGFGTSFPQLRAEP